MVQHHYQSHLCHARNVLLSAQHLEQSSFPHDVPWLIVKDSFVIKCWVPISSALGTIGAERLYAYEEEVAVFLEVTGSERSPSAEATRSYLDDDLISSGGWSRKCWFDAYNVQA